MEQAAILNNYKKFEEVFKNSPVAFYSCDNDAYITYFNEAAVEAWGQRPVAGKEKWGGLWKVYDENMKPISFDESPMVLALKNKKSYNGVEIIIERPDHSFKNLLLFPKVITNEQNEIEGLQVTFVDISSHKKEDVKNSILSAIVESSDDAIVSKTLEGIITSWNKGAQKIFEYTEGEIIGKSIYLLIPDNLQDEEAVIIQSIKAGRKIDHFRTIRRTKSGRLVHVSITVSPVKDKHGNIIGASKIARDISDQIHNEDVLRQTVQRLEILHSISKTISEKLDVQATLQKVTDATTIITGAAFGAFFYNTVNKDGEAYMLYTLSGAPREAFEKLGMPRKTEVFRPTFNGDYIFRSDDITKDPRYGKNKPYNGMPQGHLPVVSYMAVPVISGDGSVIGGLLFGHPDPGVFKDEHEDILRSIATQAAVALDNSKLYEEVKSLSNKKDEFIALASHELKTPLTTIKGYIQLLQIKSTDELTKLFADKALLQAERLNSLISDLFDISKIESGRLQLNYERFDVVQFVKDIVDTFQYSSPSYSFIYNPPNELLILEADKQRIEQVVVNLLTNAVKYSKEGSVVYLTTCLDEDKICLKVKDEGIGLTQEHLNNIFTKFYRAVNNPNLPGLGLGLYLAKEIVVHHNGTIHALSELGKGTEFIVSLPVNKNSNE